MAGYGYASEGRFPSVASAIWPAALAAGPIFLTAAALATLYLELPRPVVVPLQSILHFLFLLIPATVVGTILATLPVLLAAAMLHWLGRHSDVLRSTMAWVAVGAGAGALLAWLIDTGFQERQLGFALTATAATCALITRRRLYPR